MLAALALVAHRRGRWLWVLPLPLVFWNHAGWVIAGSDGAWWSWLPANWPYAQDSLYPSGNILHFVALLPAVTSPLLFPAACLGVWRSLRESLEDWHLQICQGLIAIIPLLILLVHSVLYATGKLASSGELRYMLVVAPFWGLLSAKGWEWLILRLRFKHPFRWAAVAVLAAWLANAAYPVLPLSATDDHLRAERFVEWYRSSDLERRFPRVSTPQMSIYFFLDVSPTDPARAMEFHRRNVIGDPPAGVMLVWDPIYGLYNSDAQRSIPIDEVLAQGWIELTDGVPDLGGGWRVLISPRHQE